MVQVLDLNSFQHGNSRKKDTTEEFPHTENVTLHPKTSDVLSVAGCTAGELDQRASTHHMDCLKGKPGA